MPGHLARVLTQIETEAEAPIYALERLRAAFADDGAADDEARERLERLHREGTGPSFGVGWADFFARAVRISARPA